MLTPEREILLESAVVQFLSHEEGSRIIKKRSESFLVQVGGMELEQLKWHRKMIFCSLGLWFPVYFTVALLRRPRIVELYLHPVEVRVIIKELS
jgi:hypothetical protein